MCIDGTGGSYLPPTSFLFRTTPMPHLLPASPPACTASSPHPTLPHPHLPLLPPFNTLSPPFPLPCPPAPPSTTPAPTPSLSAHPTYLTCCCMLACCAALKKWREGLPCLLCPSLTSHCSRLIFLVYYPPTYLPQPSPIKHACCSLGFST